MLSRRDGRVGGKRFILDTLIKSRDELGHIDIFVSVLCSYFLMNLKLLSQFLIQLCKRWFVSCSDSRAYALE